MKAFAIRMAVGIIVVMVYGYPAFAGPYSTGMANSVFNAPDAGIPGFVGPDGNGKCLTGGPNNYVNPIFKGWANGVVEYDAALGVATRWADANKTLGPVTGSKIDIASLGDMTTEEITAWRDDPVANHGPGTITLSFDYSITNENGADFAVFENGFISAGEAGVAGQVFAELAYVEVSTNGGDFARFSSVSLTSGLVGEYGTIDPTNVYNLAGKHVNADGDSWGTPFNLDDLSVDAKVMTGLVDLSEINYVRLVDIPGNGNFYDSLGNPIYDAWLTWGSGGLDLEAVGVINQVPEPGTLLVASIGGMGMWWIVHRHRKRRASGIPLR